jgi:flagellar motor switch protein FliG
MKLTGLQKAAIFIMSLDPRAAKQLMGKFGVKEKDMIRRATSKIKKAARPIFLKMWEAFKRDVEGSPACKTPWPNKTSSPKQAPAPGLPSKPASPPPK